MKYKFNAFSLWGIGSPDFPQEMESILHEAYPDWYLSGCSMALDNWLRGVIDLSDDQAARMRIAVDGWNKHMEAYPITFQPEDGSGHEIEVIGPNGHSSYSWQWGGR